MIIKIGVLVNKTPILLINEQVLVSPARSGVINSSSVVDTACYVATHHQNIV